MIHDGHLAKEGKKEFEVITFPVNEVIFQVKDVGHQNTQKHIS